MNLSCDWSWEELDGDGWSYRNPVETVLKTKNSRRCCSCECKVAPGEVVVMFSRYRQPISDIEDRIHGDDVPLASWWMCETCGDMFWSLDALGFCVIIGAESMCELTRQYAETYGRSS